ncbi:hypothetical protein V1512DRAFT_250083 [Lipomyces arxii]|uniref:uncharacterized protein n=1 Tax=Lipomyces arxii TaxID=56418 RepID=UPI0034CEF044
MDSSSHFASVPLRGSRGFSWIFLIELIVTGIATIFVLFYFNRVIATLISLSARWYTWHKFRVFIDVRSVQISLLGGRIFFKDLRYVGSNETVFITQGHVTWRYWLNRTRRSDLKVAKFRKEKNETVPARFMLYIEGVEWFVYNRTSAYEAALKEFDTATATGSCFADNKNHKQCGPDGNLCDTSGLTNDKLNGSAAAAESSSTESFPTSDDTEAARCTKLQKPIGNTSTTVEAVEKLSPILGLFPIDVLCSKGAMVLGNSRTPTIMVYHFSSAVGFVDTSPSASVYDQYKMVYDFTFNKPSMQMKANMDYKEGQVDSQDHLISKSSTAPIDLSRAYRPSKWQSFKDLFFFLHGRFFPPTARSTETNDVSDRPWQGLSMYLEESKIELTDSSEQIEEYAKCTSVLDADQAKFTFYYDIPGKVPYDAVLSKSHDLGRAEQINREPPPQWGIDLHLKGATIQYGPWADRQRVILQSIFFPGVHVDSTPSEPISPGSYRFSTEFKIYVEMDDNTIIRIPIREPSRDAEYKRQAETKLGNSIRSFGWIELKLAELSTLTFVSGLVPASDGWPRYLTSEFNGVELRSSVNHDLLWSSKTYKITGDLSSPLKWNGLTNWVFNSAASEIRCFLLREHITILTDMITDFGSGPGQPYSAFIPQTYEFRFAFDEFSLFVNVNDSNIISNPTDFDDNVFLDFNSPKLCGSIQVPLDQISPITTQVRYKITAELLKLVLHAPPWNTRASFLESKDLGNVKQLSIEGSYTYTVSDQSVPIDTLCVDISSDYTSIIAYGFLVRYLIKVRENYFGDNTHFKTLDEFTRSVAAPDQSKFTGLASPEDSHDDFQDSGSTKQESAIQQLVNSTDVLVNFETNGGCLIFPTTIYSAGSHLRLDFDAFDVDLRFTNYYMDLQINISPIQGRMLDLPVDEVLMTTRKDVGGEQTALFVDGINVHGHRMFGLPPSEPTYVCNWDFDLGIVFAEGAPTLYQNLRSTLQAFSYTLADKENALIVAEPPLHDVTFFRVKLPAIRALVNTDATTIEFMTESVSLSLSDLATVAYNAYILLEIPSINLLCRDRVSGGADAGRVMCYFATSLYITNFDRKQRGYERRRLQQEHIRRHDMLFNRTPFFLAMDLESETRVDGPPRIYTTLPFPPMAPPLVSVDDYDTSSTASTSSVVHHDTEALGIKPSATTTRDYLDAYNLSCSNAESERRCDFDSTFMPPYSCVSAFKDMKSVANGFERRKYDMGNNATESDQSARLLDNTDTQFDSFVVEFRSGIDGFVSAQGVEAILEVLDGLSPPDITYMLDELQVNVIERLERNLTTVSLITSARIVIPGLHVCYGEVINTLIDSVMSPEKLTMGNHVDLEVGTATLSCRLTDKSSDFTLDQPSRRNPVHRVCSVYIILYQVKVGLIPSDWKNRLDSKPLPLELQIEEIEAWNHETQTDVTYIKVKPVGLVVQNQSIKWVTNTGLDILKPLIPIVEKLAKIKSRRETRLRNMVYQIVLTSNAYEIKHDPAFLTRPAYVLRSSKAHIRANDSWRLMARIRHISRALPSSTLQGIERDLFPDDALLPPDAKDKVVQIMQDWRSWEMVNIATSYVFAHVFDGEDKTVTIVSNAMNMFLDVETITLCIANGSEQEDYLQLAYFTLSLSSRIIDKPDNLLFPKNATSLQSAFQCQQTQRVINASAGCEEVRVITNWSSLPLIRVVTNVLNSRIQELYPSKKDAVQDMQAVVVPLPALDVEICAVVEIKKFISVVNSDNLRVQMSGNVIQSTISGIFGEQKSFLLSSFLLGANALELDVLAPVSDGEKRLLTLGIQRSNIWASVTSLPDSRAIREHFYIKGIVLKVLENIIGLASIFTQILEDEVQQFIAMFPDLKCDRNSANSAVKSPLQPKTSSSEQFKQMGVSLDLRNYDVMFNVLPSLMYGIHGSGVQIISPPVVNNVRSVAFRSGEQHHEFSQSKGTKRVKITSITFPTVTTLARINGSDDSIQAADVSIRMDTVNFDAFSFPTLASVLSGDVLKAQIVKAQLEWGTAWTRKEAVLPRSKTRSVASPPATLQNVNLRGVLFINGVVIKAESETSQIMMSITNVKVLGSTSSRVSSQTHNKPYISLSGRFPSVTLAVINERFKNGKFQIFESNLVLLCKTIEDQEGDSFRHAVALKSEKCLLELSPLSSILIVEILSQFEKTLTSIELPEELFHLSNILKEPIQSSGATDDVQTWDGIFKALIRVRFENFAFHWVSDIFANETVKSFYFSVGANQLTLSSKGDGLINVVVKQFEAIGAEQVPLKSSSKVPLESSSIIPTITVCVSLNQAKNTRALGLSIRSAEVQTRIIPSVVKVIAAMAGSFSNTADAVSGQILNYKNRSSAKPGSILGGATAAKADCISEDPEVQLQALFKQKFFSNANIKADFAGSTIELVGATNEKYTEDSSLSHRESTVEAKSEANFGKPKPTKVGPVAIFRVPGIHLISDHILSPETPSLRAEIFVEPSVNTLYPRVMPVVMEMVQNFQDTMRAPKEKVEEATKEPKVAAQSSSTTKVLGKISLNLGLRVGRQEFSLSCEPIAKVAGMVAFDEVYMTLGTLEKSTSSRAFTCALQLFNLKASLQHIYSRESSGQIAVKESTFSALASHKLGRVTGLSLVSNVRDITLDLNIKQSHDLLLFQDIWSPGLVLDQQHAHPKKTADERAEILVQRYHRVSSTNAFPWTIDFELLDFKASVDLGQSLGKVALSLDKLWLASRKSSDWDQNLTFGFTHVEAECKGRLGGQVAIESMRVRSGIKWEVLEDGQVGVPLITVSAGLEKVSGRLFFDYRLFLIAVGSSAHVTMFNQKGLAPNFSDRLVCVVDCSAIRFYLTVLAPSNILAILSTIQRLNQEQAASYQAVLRDSERFKVTEIARVPSVVVTPSTEDTPVKLGTELNVSIKTIVIDVFPSSLSDTEVLRIEAFNIGARFGISVEKPKIRSRLDLMLGQLLVALSSTKRVQEDLTQVSVEDFIKHASEAKGGTIMRVPAVNVAMKTWQPITNTNTVEFTFSGLFEGKVDVGWNLGSINLIRDMWNTHVRSFQLRQVAAADGKNYTTHLLESEELEKKIKEVELNKKYLYIPLEPPIIATPQLRDMGEATPPLEWIGLHRDRFPGLTHQAIIIALQSMSRKVELAYSNVLGKA